MTCMAFGRFFEAEASFLAMCFLRTAALFYFTHIIIVDM